MASPLHSVIHERKGSLRKKGEGAFAKTTTRWFEAKPNGEIGYFEVPLASIASL
jgi:hypothetical protein